MSKPTILFVHGAFHTPSSFSPLATLLRKDGYPCIDTLKLPGTGNTSVSGLAEDAEALRNAVLGVLDGEKNNCVVAMHSYGGVVGAQGLTGLGRKERETEGRGTSVLKMVFLSANVPRDGGAHFAQISAWMGQHGREMPAIVDVRDGTGFFVGDENVFYNDLSAEVQKELMGKLEGQSMATLMTPIEAPAYREILGWYLVAGKDNVLVPEFQRYMAEVPGDMMEVVEEIDAGHCRFIGEPGKVRDFIVRAAEDGMKGFCLRAAKESLAWIGRKDLDRQRVQKRGICYYR